jgi:membrane protein YqaA with SNARE-associated domain
LTEPVSLGALFVTSFLSATLLPGGSEVVFSGLLLSGAVATGPAIAVATLGNSLGGLSTYLLGWLLPDRVTDARAVKWLRRWGSPALLLSWAPIIGDALCFAAGWLRFGPLQSAIFIALGKFARYWVLAEIVMA